MFVRIPLRTASSGLVTRSMLVVLLVSAAFLALARESDACSVVPLGSPSEELQKQSRVFAGKIVAVHKTRNGIQYEFRVDTVWKGPLLETMFFWRSDTSPSTNCGDIRDSFVVDSEYIVYVYGFGRIGSRTGFLKYAHEDIAELGEGQRPIPGTSEDRELFLDESNPFELLTVVLVVLIIGILVASSAKKLLSGGRSRA